jgi:exosortase
MTGRNLKVASTVLIGLLLLAVFYPTLKWLLGEWLGNDYYSHGPLVPLISAFLAWRLWVRWPAAQRQIKPATLGLLPIGIGLAAYLYALFQRAYFVASLAMIVIIAGLVWYLLGTAALRRFAFPIGFLFFMVPLPFIEPLSVPLALFTGTASAAIVQLFGVPIVVNGAQITLPNSELVVGAQCSGLRSIVTLMTLVALVIFLVEGSWWKKLLLALSSVLIAGFGNIMRVASLLVVANVWGADAAFKYYHDYSGIVFFLSALALLLLFSWVLGCREIRDDIF